MESLQRMEPHEKNKIYQRLAKLHQENETERKNYLLGKGIYVGKKSNQSELECRKKSKQNIPVTFQMYERAKILSEKQTDYGKSGVLTMQDEGPPGQKFSHLGLQQLYQNRLKSLEIFQKNRHFDEKMLQKQWQKATTQSHQIKMNEFMHNKRLCEKLVSQSLD